MNQPFVNSSSTNDLPRCQHRTRGGRRCRNAVSSIKAGFCPTHAPARSNRSEESDLSAYLTAGLTEFKSPVPINDFLSRLLHLEAEDRISPRHAAVMAYTCNLILRTLPAVDKDSTLKTTNSKSSSIFPARAVTSPPPKSFRRDSALPHRQRPKLQGVLMPA